MAFDDGKDLNGILGRKEVNRGRRSTTWHGMAFVVESLVLLVFLTAALAVFSMLLGVAHTTGANTRQLTTAVLAANDVAEQFAA